MEELLKLLLNFANKSKRKIFLVGGSLRDLLLRRETKDFDLVPEGDAKKFARNFASEVAGSFVLLDEKNKIYRVVKQRLSEKKGKQVFNLDFSQMRGEKIKQDLLRRDFTIDAMAVRLDQIEGSLETLRRVKLLTQLIVDPSGGIRDLRKKIVRRTSRKIFDDDPLRLLRGYRLAATLEFAIEENTEDEIKKKVNLIKNVARERIRDELLKILSAPKSYLYFRRLHRVGLLNRIIPEIETMKEKPENYYHREGLWGHSLETLKSLEEILANLVRLFPGMSRKIIVHLDEKIFGEVERKSLLKWAAIFHDIGKPKTVRREERRVRFFGHEEAGTTLVMEIMERLKFSNKAIKIVGKTVEHHMRPGNLSEAPQLTDRAIHRFFRDLSQEGVDTLLLSLADRYSYRKILPERQRKLALEISQKSIRKHEKTVIKMLRKYYYHKERILPKPLVRGDEIMESLNLPQGPLIGKLLKRVGEAQAGGKLKNKEEALQFLKKILEENKGLFP
ncbi:MAG: CCA tRNA nucleotidyltransferase [bacterium]